MNPYYELGLARDADDKDINKAFRNKARKAHPDAGGSAEAFEKISMAKAVLLDQRRRRQYDETGRFDEPKPENDDAEAAAFALMAIDVAVVELEKNNLNVAHVDIIELAVANLRGRSDETKKALNKARSDAEKMRKFAERFSAKGNKPNRLRRMFETRAGDITVKTRGTSFRMSTSREGCGE